MSFWSWLISLFGRRKRPEKRIVSLVLLLREERYLDPVILRKLASNAFDVEFEDTDDADNFVVTVQDDVNFMIQAHGQMFLVNNYARPYIEDVEEVSEEIQELRLRQAVREHRAWLSVDQFGPAHLSEEASFHWIGRLLAELIDNDCTAIFCPANSRGCVYEPELDDLLRGPDPLQIFESHQRPPVLEISDTDPLMMQAVQEARDRWPEFVAAFEERQAGDVFSVKAPLSDGDMTEFMWLSVGAIENNIVFGRLDNDPVSIGRIKSGDRVRVSVDDLNDWLYTQGTRQHGGFTVAVLTKLYRKGK